MNEPNREDDPMDEEEDFYFPYITDTSDMGSHFFIREVKPMRTLVRDFDWRSIHLHELSLHHIMLGHYAEAVDRIYDDNRAVEKFSTLTSELRTFAILLYFCSPICYFDFLYNCITPLPSQRVLLRWFENDRLHPGFTAQSFRKLARRRALKGPRMICSLQAGFISLQKGCSEAIDVGAGPIDDRFGIVPNEIFVILLVSINELWKIPIGYFIGHQVSVHTTVGLQWMALYHAHEAGVDVVSVTMPSATECRILGCEIDDPMNLVTTIKHPVSDRQIALFVDPTLSLVNIRNHFENTRVLYNLKNQKIRWEPISLLKTIDRFKSSNIRLRHMFAQLDLYSEVFNYNLLAILSTCKNTLKLQKYQDIKPLITFIVVLNKICDFLGSSHGVQPISRANSQFMMGMIEKFRTYICSIHYVSTFSKLMGHSFPQICVEDKWVTGYKGFLVSFESLKYLYRTLVEEENLLDSIPADRLCLDHALDFYVDVRSHCSIKGNQKFQSIYESILGDKGHNFITGRTRIISYPIGHLDRALEAIRLTSGMRSHVEICKTVDEVSRSVEDHELDSKIYEVSIQLCSLIHLRKRKKFVGYLAAWLAMQLAKDLRCETCVVALFMPKPLWFHRYITKEEFKRMCLPSEMIFQICWECERMIKSSGGVRLGVIDVATLRRLVSRVSYIAHGHPHGVHRQHLARAVVAKYVKLRTGEDDPRELKDKIRVPIPNHMWHERRVEPIFVLS